MRAYLDKTGCRILDHFNAHYVHQTLRPGEATFAAGRLLTGKHPTGRLPTLRWLTKTVWARSVHLDAPRRNPGNSNIALLQLN